MGVIGKPYPENGWLVLCMGMGKYYIANPDRNCLESVLASIIEERDKEDSSLPIQVYELGPELKWRMRYHLSLLEPMDE
jgi:hypothetical protein